MSESKSSSVGPRGKRSALIIVDVQNDFVTGSLAVPKASEIIPVINRLRQEVNFSLVVTTRDQHPAEHVSFLRSHANNPAAASLAYGQFLTLPDGSQQVMWPVHCVAGSEGGELCAELVKNANDVMIDKGTDKEVDSYSAFYDNARAKSTELASILKKNLISDVYVCGLAFDYCVAFTALDAKQEGLEVWVVEDACRGITEDGVQRTKTEMTHKGIHIINSSYLREARSDRRETAAAYLEKHNIQQLMEKLCSNLAFHQPSEPRAFLIQQLQAVQKDGMKALTLMNQQDLETLFNMRDPLHKGVLSADQVKGALNDLGVSDAEAHVKAGSTYSREQFVALATKALQ